MLPEGWKIFRGEEIAQKITKGQSPKWQGFEYQKDGAIFITSENVRDGFLDISRPKFLPVEFSNKIKGSQLKKGDVLINLVGASIGRSCLYEKSLPHANINQAVCTFRTNSHADPHFLALFFQHPKTIDRLICGQNASARPNISLGDIKNFEVLLPPLPEQKKIAAILSTWDRAIEGTEKLLANSQQQKKALMQQLLTGKKRLPGFAGEWKIGTLSEIAHIDTGFAFKSSEFTDNANDMPIVRMSDLKEGTLHLENCKRLHLNSLSGLEKFSLKEKDFIFGMSGSLSNFAWVKKSNLPCYLNQRVGRIRSKKTGDQEFISYLYLSEKIQKEIEDKAAGAAQLNISLNDIRSMKLQIPPLSEQKAIAAVLTTADEEITTLESDLSRLRQEKKALMQQLLTGKRRVTVD